MGLRLFVADDVRQLVDGKTLAVGLFTDSVVVLNVPAAAIAQIADVPLAIDLSFLACLFEIAPGGHNFIVSIQAPDGTVSIRFEAVRDVGPMGSINLILNVRPFVVRTGGQYTMVASVDGGVPLRDSFEVRLVASDVGSDAPATPELAQPG